MINLEDRSNTILLIKELRTEMDLTGEISYYIGYLLDLPAL
jgi:hypothetical protein